MDDTSDNSDEIRRGSGRKRVSHMIRGGAD